MSSSSSSHFSTTASPVLSEKNEEGTDSPKLTSSILTSALNSSSTACNMLIPQLLEHNLHRNSICTMCHQSLHLHSQSAGQLSSTSSNTSKSVLDKNVIHDLPQWKKDYKVCNTFFNSLEQLFHIHNITDESLYKRYLHLTLNELHDSDRTYAFNHIINTEHSWDQIKSLFAQRFETYDHVNRLRKQYNDIRYTNNDTIQTFSNRFINICNDLSYDVDDPQTIHKFLTLLPHEMHRRLLLSIETAEKSIEDYTTLSSIVQKIIRLENAQNNAAFVTSSDNSSTKRSNNNNTNNTHRSASSAPAKHCAYHPNLSSHTTTECRTGPAKAASKTSFSSPATPAKSSSTFASTLSTPGRSQIICHHCGKAGHIKPNCPDLAPSKPKLPQPSPFTAPTLTRSAYAANGVKPTASGPTPSYKTVSTTDSNSSSSANVAF